MTHYTADDDIPGYWERNYVEWAAADRPDWGVFDTKDKWFEERMAHLLPLPDTIQPGSRVLDYGCGNAMYAVPLLRRFEFYDGFDTSLTAIKIATSYYLAHKRELWPRMEIFHYLNSPGNWGMGTAEVYDCVMSITVLQHQPTAERLAMIRDIKTLLKPSGIYLGLEWIGDTQAYDMPPMTEAVWRAAWAPWELTFDLAPGHPGWAENNVWTARLPHAAG